MSNTQLDLTLLTYVFIKVESILTEKSAPTDNHAVLWNLQNFCV